MFTNKLKHKNFFIDSHQTDHPSSSSPRSTCEEKRKKGGEYKTRKSTLSEKAITPKLLHADYYYNCMKYLPHITLPS